MANSHIGDHLVSMSNIGEYLVPGNNIGDCPAPVNRARSAATPSSSFGFPWNYDSIKLILNLYKERKDQFQDGRIGKVKFWDEIAEATTWISQPHWDSMWREAFRDSSM
ncbi:unnamed protein product [Darwinula stevensoni]|uniref:Uncharacterized protein n=1 Tax=Darwinula stevensoni TaxID=69355 RepID=A0A7R8X9J9_9CRUS|nr:unnamed protein product [Darwinula stevensoni]CAG0891168.1 unnamed protein product [Darwinula stevensoni]